MAVKRLAEMPRSVRCKLTRLAGELFVTWEVKESFRNNSKPFWVKLHKGDCDEPAERCDCPARACTDSFSVLFRNLKLDEKYSPEVWRDTEGAFQGLRPAHISPLTEDLTIPTREQPANIPISKYLLL